MAYTKLKPILALWGLASAQTHPVPWLHAQLMTCACSLPLRWPVHLCTRSDTYKCAESELVHVQHARERVRARASAGERLLARVGAGAGN
eukprot:6189770-Pleurochrysis_carterae.AAC.1